MFARKRKKYVVSLPGLEQTAPKSLSVRVWEEVVQRVGSRYGAKGSRASLRRGSEDLLIQAGYSDPNPEQFFTIQVGMACGFAVVALLAGFLLNNPLQGGILFIIASVLGFLLPRIYVRRKAAARMQRALNEATGWLSNYAILIATGMSAINALQEISLIGNGVLYSESRFAARQVVEMNLPLEDALDGMARRIGSGDVASALKVLRDRVAGDDHFFRMALLAEADSIQTLVYAQVRQRMADNMNYAVGVMVLFAFPLLMYVVVAPFIVRLIGALGGA